jgi:hypothetical protein
MIANAKRPARKISLISVKFPTALALSDEDTGTETFRPERERNAEEIRFLSTLGNKIPKR